VPVASRPPSRSTCTFTPGSTGGSLRRRRPSSSRGFSLRSGVRPWGLRRGARHVRSGPRDRRPNTVGGRRSRGFVRGLHAKDHGLLHERGPRGGARSEGERRRRRPPVGVRALFGERETSPQLLADASFANLRAKPETASSGPSGSRQGAEPHAAKPIRHL
jgi:hypothetical protein